MLEKAQRMKFKPVDRQDLDAGDVPPSAEEVEAWVLEALGRPPDYAKTTVRRITPNNFRVNVYSRSGSFSKLTDSFFVGFFGGRFESSPPVRRKYEGA